MDQTTINRYQSGGDIYATLAGEYGTPAANAIAAAALTGSEQNVNAAISNAQFGAPLNTSTASILGTQLATDPLAAPLADANGLLNNTFLSFLENPTVILTALALGWLFFFGGLAFLKNKIEKVS